MLYQTLNLYLEDKMEPGMSQDEANTEAGEKEMADAAKRSIAFQVLPSVISSFDYGMVHPGIAAREVVKRAYEIAAEMLAQGDNPQ
jgi:hypothetical protein